MNRFRHKHFLALLIAAALLFTSCSPQGSQKGSDAETGESYRQTQTAPDSQEALAEQQRFDDYTMDIFINDVQANTINLHYILADPSSYGITDYPIQMGEITTDSIKEDFRSLHESVEELNDFQYDLLTAEQKLTWDILNYYLETELTLEDMVYYSEPLGPTVGAPAQLPITMGEYQFYREQDIKDYLELLPQIKEYFASISVYEWEKANRGLFMSDQSLDDNLKVISDFMQDTDDNLLITTFDERIDHFEGLDDSQKQAYKDQNRTIVLETVLPAFQTLADDLEKLRGKGSNDKGLSYFEHGREYYEYLLASNIGTSSTPDELLKRIEKKLYSQIMAMSTLVSAQPDLENSFSTFSFPLTDPTEILEALKLEILDDYPELPDTNYTIKYVSESLEDSLSPAFYMVPPLDRVDDHTIYINRKLTDEADLYPTLAHEGYPGHLYQSVYENIHCSDPIRQLISYRGYSEGWATYVEYESYLYDDSINPQLAKLMSLNASISLGVYAMLDININYNGWTIEQTGELISDYFGQLDDSVVREIYYALVEEPSYYLCYYSGYLEIATLRAQAEKELGENFVLKDFHQFILDMGNCPFNIIETYFEDWLNQTAGN